MKLTVKDSKGIPVELNDWVRVTGDHYRNSPSPFCFYVQVKIIENGGLQPFENFSFDQIEKVDGPPEGIEMNRDGFYFVRGVTETIKEYEERAYAIQSRFFETVKEKFFVITAN